MDKKTQDKKTQKTQKTQKTKDIQNTQENLIKKTCKDLKLSYRELGKLIGYSEATLNKNASTNTISKALQRAIELYLEILELQKELKTYYDFKNSIVKMMIE